MEEKSQKQNPQDLNPLFNKEGVANNLNIKPTINEELGVDLTKSSDINLSSEKTNSINKESLINEKNQAENLTTARDASVFDLNAELSKLSKDVNEGVSPKTDDIIEVIKEETKTEDQVIPEIKIPENQNTNPLMVKQNEENPQPPIQEKQKSVSSNPQSTTETENIKENTNNSTKKSPGIIRTYQNDLVEVVKTKKISMTQAVMMEKNNKSGKHLGVFPEIKKSTRKKIYLSILSIFLIISGITFVFFVYYYKPTPLIKVDNIEVKSFVDSEYQKEIFLEKSNIIKLTSLIQTELNKTDLPIGSLLHLYLTDRHTDESNLVGKKILTTNELFYLLNSRVSESFLRFIEPDFMYGYYSSLDIFPFLILKTRSFDNTFPEILEWEKNLIEDLRPIFIEENPTIPSSELRTREFEFKDLVIKNKDTRAILNNSGEVIFIYSFVDKNTIVITTNKIVLQEISNRLILKSQKR